MPPRGLDPRGVILVDKTAGPTSFDVVAAVRRRTGARTGHAGTLDPFATGLLLLLSGAATSLQPRFVGLDKRYVTEIDLSARTSTGDPEGEVVEEHEPPAPSERAYRLHRRGVAVEMPLRRSHVRELRLERYEDGGARIDLLVSSGTYVRAIADLLGGHCRTLRRTEVGPFSVDEADPERIIPPDEALSRLT
jgi:tRNA pseudouridine55 synthase